MVRPYKKNTLFNGINSYLIRVLPNINVLIFPSEQVNDLKATIADMEKERDFYFGKLRNIELICQEKEGEGDPTLQKIVDILYATDVSVFHNVRLQ